MKEKRLLAGMPMSLLTMAAAFVLASSADLRAAAGMSIMIILATVLSSAVIIATSRIVPKKIKLVVNILIITGFVSILNMLFEAFFPIAVNLLGVHLAAIAACPVIFRDADTNGNGEDDLTIGVAFTTALFLSLVMVVCALVREALGSATIWGHPIAFLESAKIPFLAGPFGGYLIVAIVIAVVNVIVAACKKDKKEEEAK